MAKAPIECLHSGDLYIPSDPEVMNEQLRCLDKLAELNSTKPSDLARREELCKEIFAEFGEGSYVELPFHSNFGGKHCHLGKYVYLNFNCTLTDDTHIYIGDYTMFGPNCVIATAGHPIDPDLRRQGYQYNFPVHIGKNCWLGAGVIVTPGVTIGDNVVIGAGSVVTKDIPSNVVAMGTPCKVVREVNEHDKEFYFKDRRLADSLGEDF